MTTPQSFPNVLVQAVYGHPLLKPGLEGDYGRELISFDDTDPSSSEIMAWAEIMIGLPCDEERNLSTPFLDPFVSFMGEKLSPKWGFYRWEGAHYRTRKEFLCASDWNKLILMAEQRAACLLSMLKNHAETYHRLYGYRQNFPETKRRFIDVLAMDNPVLSGDQLYRGFGVRASPF